MGFADFYLERQHNFKVKIQEQPNKDLKYIVVIPCYNEFDLINTLNSIKETERIKKAIEVIIVINSSEISNEDIKEQNRKTYNEVKNWIQNNQNSLLRFFILLEENLPRKFAGAGLARKIGMDQAIARFNQLNIKDGVIISLDADAKVSANYFLEIDKFFSKNTKANAATLYFEHPIDNTEFSQEICSSITIYELYLRYYKLALSFTGFPYSYYTIGSCFAVNTQAYVKQGGMNRKQAGEDFYFLHKIFPLGHCAEINTTCVYPSPRISDRVPFGTGPMVKSIVESGTKGFKTYNFQSFLDLKQFFEVIENLYKIDSLKLDALLNNLPKSISEFLILNNVEASVQEINANSSNLKSFLKRFFNWFDAFKVLKYMNFTHENYCEKQELLDAVELLNEKISIKKPIKKDYRTYLDTYREFEMDSSTSGIPV